jgi:hypothetical protein
MPTMRRLAEEQQRTIDSGADIAEKHIRGVLGDRAGDLLQALSPEARPAIAREAFRRLVEDEATPDDVALWLSIEVRGMRWRGEAANETAARTRSERRRGADSTNAVKRDRLQAWREWISANKKVSHPREAPASFKHGIIDVILFRAGELIPEPSLNRRVPGNLPNVFGRGEKPPKKDTLRKSLFGPIKK